MIKKVVFTVVTATILGGGCYLYIRNVLKDKDKYANRILKMFYDGEGEDDDSSN